MKRHVNIRVILYLTIIDLFFVLPAHAERNIVKAIQKWNAEIAPSDQKNKYCKMAASPFIFYRGSNHLFWNDFANDSRLKQFGNKNTHIWIQGDLHAYNFGAYENAEGDIVYGLNDFDESVIADYQYDLWRMAISLVLIARENQELSAAEQEKVIEAFIESYLATLADVRGNNKETKTVFSTKKTAGQLKSFLKEVEKQESRKKMLKKWTKNTKKGRQFDLSLEELGAVDKQTHAEFTEAMAAYGNTLSGKLNHDEKYFTIKGIARRLEAGTGSLGTPRYYLLIEGGSDSDNDDRILDVKKQLRPTPYYYLGKTFQRGYTKNFPNDAQRHARAYQSLTLHSDNLLGWLELSGDSYSVRERSPYKESFPTGRLKTKKQFMTAAEQWGRILAMAHAGADEDAKGSGISYSFEDQVLKQLKGYEDEFQTQIREIALEYAEQVEDDWQRFVKALGDACTN